MTTKEYHCHQSHGLCSARHVRLSCRSESNGWSIYFQSMLFIAVVARNFQHSSTTPDLPRHPTQKQVAKGRWRTDGQLRGETFTEELRRDRQYQPSQQRRFGWQHRCMQRLAAQRWRKVFAMHPSQWRRQHRRQQRQVCLRPC